MAEGFQTRNSRSTSASAKTRKWAIVRLILGQAQVIGATATLVFLIQTGESALTIWAAIVTAVLTLSSLLLFKSRWKVI
ncbi:MAG: hypothetical protein ABS95_00325 [Verrucomicrobia bacterium SCN 57-15]|nr:MAG: hypothetical protein ABS95_00325 [Verrucomicrobia bacterium SCN 57-15]